MTNEPTLPNSENSDVNNVSFQPGATVSVLLNSTRIASIGSPSSNSHIALDLNDTGKETPLVGSLVAVENHLADRTELALGTIIEITTRNSWHENPTYRGAYGGENIPTLSGQGDYRVASVSLQAAWHRYHGQTEWHAAGPSLRMSPTTGNGVHSLSRQIVHELTASTPQLHSIGWLGGAADTPLPLNIPDFSSDMGAFHLGVFGQSGSGKALSLSTPIPTPNGWTTMGDIQTGDTVFDENGQTTFVLKAHDVLHGRTCYKVIFSNWSSIIADAEHLWTTTAAETEGEEPATRTRTTEQILETLTTSEGQVNHTLPQVSPLDLPENPNFTVAQCYHEGRIRKQTGHSPTSPFSDIARGSIQQRVAYLFGVLGLPMPVSARTGDIKWEEALTTTHEIVLLNSSEDAALPNDVCETLASLGFSPEKISHGNDMWTVKWSHEPVMIMAVVPVDSEPVRCITVDSPNRLYLAGESMIPTHNTVATSYLLASQMRYENFGMIIVDPQGQWASEHGLPFSMQTFAEELGRPVSTYRISETIRLSKDNELLVTLLKHTRMKNELYMKHVETEEIMWQEIKKALKVQDDWDESDSRSLLRYLLEVLASDDVAKKIYTSPDRIERFQDNVLELLHKQDAFNGVLTQFAPIHNLFQAKNPGGEDRVPLHTVLKNVFLRSGEDATKPAPLLIMDMSTRAAPSMDDEYDEAVEDAYNLLDQDEVKAEILRSVFRSLKRSSESAFRSGKTLNTMIVLDEAWRFAAPTRGVDGPVADLSRDLAGYARDTRKFGIGWFYISQSPYSINPDIWGQMSVRVFGYGLTGGDVDKMGEVVDRKESVALYRTFGNPRSTRVYPFLLLGPVSPLAANASPLVVNTYTNFDDFRVENNDWIAHIRQKLGKPVLSGVPSKTQSSFSAKPVAAPLRKKLVESNKEISEHKKEVGVSNPESYSSDPFDELNDEDFDPGF